MSPRAKRGVWGGGPLYGAGAPPKILRRFASQNDSFEATLCHADKRGGVAPKCACGMLFRDVLEVGREQIYHMPDFKVRFPEDIVTN